MKIKDKIITCVIAIFIILIYIVSYVYQDKNNNTANEAYLVYINNEKIGMISNEYELYDMINDEQKAIKKQYSVDVVYPPKSFDIVKTNTYDEKFNTIDDIYGTIAEIDSFTIKGYIITIKFPEEDKKEDLVINVLDKSIFEEAIKNFILSFITEEEFNKYLEGGERTIKDIGSVIQTMYFNETITIKEGLISVKDKIFTDSQSLSQYLLFGDNAQMSSYVVEYGDDIESISEAHSLNPQEFIIANPTLRGTDTVLSVGSTVNITLLNPVITLVCEMFRIEETSVPFSKKTVVDNTKPYGYSEVTQVGVAGITRNHEYYQVKNGEPSAEVKIEKYEEVRAAVDQITTVGKTYVAPQPSTSGSYVDIGGNWGWPTNQPSIITSRYAWRWGKMHEGIDISGTGYGSPIYAIGDGVVVRAEYACKSCAQWANGTYVVVNHENGYYSAYLHLSAFNVSVGQRVTKGQRIASMGQSGLATGTHLHLGFFRGEPYSGSGAQSMDPLKVLYS